MRRAVNWYLICAGIMVSAVALAVLAIMWAHDKWIVVGIAGVTAFCFLLSWLLVKGTGH